MLGLVQNKFLIGRDEFSPFSAEIHYFRVPKRFWSICFDRLKKANFRIISSYVPWNLHEEKPGAFDFQGITNPFTDLIVFLELAREFGFKIILKPGPYFQAEWPDGGLPRYLFADESLIARDASGGLLTARVDTGVKSGYQPSYSHPKYQNHIRRYLAGLVDAIQNYIFPKGPVFLLQLEDQHLFGGNHRIFESDYNNHVTTVLYPAYLESKYGTVKDLPPGYPKVKSFIGIAPPIDFHFKKNEQLTPYFDWLEFKAKLIEDHYNFLKDRFEALGVGCMFSVVTPAAVDFSLPIAWDKIHGEKTLVGPAINFDDDYYQIASRVREVKSYVNYCWSPQVAVGYPSRSPETVEADLLVRQKHILMSSLSAGLKGLNYYMFVGRDHWAGPPLGSDGTVYDIYEVIRRLNVAVEAIGLNTLQSTARTAIGVYRPYRFFNDIPAVGDFSYMHELIQQTQANLAVDFCQLNYDFNICDLEQLGNLENTKIMFVPIGGFMDDNVQKRLAELIAKGIIVVFIGLVPEYNLSFDKSRTLRRALGVDTKSWHNPSLVVTDRFSFRAITYGYVSAKGSARPIARADGKTVGVFRKTGKGRYYLFTYDLSARGEPGKLGFIKSLLEENDITTPVSSSDPTVHVILQSNDKGAALFIINADMGQAERQVKRVVVAADLSRAGIRQSKIELVDILADQNITSTAADLKNGLILDLSRLDSRLYWIAKK